MPKVKNIPTTAATLSTGVFGAVIGATAATARSIPAVRSGAMSKEQALGYVAKEAGTTGVAAGTAAAVAGYLGTGGFLSLVSIAVVATGTKYALDNALSSPEPKVQE
ncbi:MAG: hypothetical protein ACNI27_10485 [Desulfovibrio sp.]